ncbi:MAG: HAD hydrolase-like protein [Candidatus Saccharimonadales bacterium]
MIKVIAFDLGGVLFSEGKAVAYKRLEADFSYDTKVINDILTSPQSIDLRKGLMADNDFWGWAQQNLPINYDVNAIKTYWYDGYIIDEDIVELLRSLKGKYELMVFSGNVESRIDYLETKYNFRELFDKEVYSFDYHHIKPEKMFVEDMINASGVLPKEIAYIDDKQEDSREAIPFGINVIIYKTGNIPKLKDELRNLGVK